MMIPESARGSAMGRAYVASIEGSNTIFWNPGGAAFLESIGFSLSYNPYYMISDNIEDFGIYSFSGATNIRKRFVLGFICQKMKRYIEQHSTDLHSIYFMKDNIEGVSACVKLGCLGIGINLKRIYSKRNIFGMKSHVTITDLGILYKKNVFKFLGYKTTCNVGISLLNIAKQINYEYLKPENLPLNFKAGYQLNFIPNKNKKYLRDFSFSHSLQYSDILNTASNYIWNYKSVGIGFEGLYKDLFFLRTGYYYQKGYKRVNEYYSPYEGLTYGVGINLPINQFIPKIPFLITYDYARFPYGPFLNNKKNDYLSLHTIHLKYNP